MKRCTFFKALDDVMEVLLRLMALTIAGVLTFAGSSAILLLLYWLYKFVMKQ